VDVGQMGVENARILCASFVDGRDVCVPVCMYVRVCWQLIADHPMFADNSALQQQLKQMMPQYIQQVAAAAAYLLVVTDVHCCAFCDCRND